MYQCCLVSNKPKQTNAKSVIPQVHLSYAALSGRCSGVSSWSAPWFFFISQLLKNTSGGLFVVDNWETSALGGLARLLRPGTVSALFYLFIFLLASNTYLFLIGSFRIIHHLMKMEKLCLKWEIIMILV